MKRKMRWLPLTATLAVVVGLFVAACGGGAEPTSTPRPAPTPTATPVTGVQPTPVATPTAAPPTATPAPTVKRGGTITLAAGSDTAGLDAGKVASHTISYFLGNDWSQLVRFDNKRWSDSDLVGDLATSWSVSPDGKAYTFKLDPNARWQNLPPVNGRALTAQDVKWFYELILDESFGSPHRAIIRDVSTVEAPDAQTVVFNLKDPFIGFANALANPRIKIMNREHYEADGNTFAKRLIGSGAWQLKAHERGARILHERNNVYWKKGVDGNPLPYVDQVEWIIIPDAATTTAGIRTGRFGFTSVSGLAADQASKFIRDNPKVNVTLDHSLFISTLIWNMKKEPFKSNLALRRALIKVIDQNLLIGNLFPPEIEAPWQSPLSSGMEPWTLSQDEVKKLLAFDPKEGRELLVKAGFTPGNITFDMSNQLPAPQDLQGPIFVQMLKDAGINTTYHLPATASEGYGYMFSFKYDLLFATVGYEGDIYSYWRSFYRCGGNTNKSGICDATLDAQIDQFEKTQDLAGQVKLAQEMQRYMLDQALFLPYRTAKIYIAMQPTVKNYARNWPWGLAGLENAWLDR